MRGDGVIVYILEELKELTIIKLFSCATESIVQAQAYSTNFVVVVVIVVVVVVVVVSLSPIRDIEMIWHWKIKRVTGKYLPL